MKMDDEPARAYATGLTDADSLPKLKAFIAAYETDLVRDAKPIVEAMTEADFKLFRIGLAKERRGRFAGEEWAARFVAVLMPDPMFTISRVADEYKVPFVIAMRRLKDVRPELFR